ncbi:unnamed protein product [Staurois parvus]|uniref:Uncharacterized protein n=1 Tax=Staurois parvus TaxID=386267 RepID=A0ABN9GJB2_9NEOB|nr:unnamed protein product [Staurois parvus]
MYTQTHVRTYTQTHTHVHTHRHMNTHIHVHTRRHMHNCTCIHRHTQTHTHVHVHTHTPPHKKLQYFVVHSQSRVLHFRGRQRAQHTLLALLSLRSAIERSDGSQCQ